VSVGGSSAYRAWDKSTYFEFESDPSRSNGFFVSRVVDHPFKFLKSPSSAKYRDESDQVILTFENRRSNLTVKCVTCENLVIQKATDYAPGASPELASVGLAPLPQALFNQKITLAATRPVWLPPRRRHAAPHLLVDSDGKNHLIWMSRNNPEDTMSCVVLSDAAKLLTSTLPRLDNCTSQAGSKLTMVEVDMFATSPLPMEVPGAPAKDRIFATGISAQKAKENDLSFCSRSAARTIDTKNEEAHDDQAKCSTLASERVAKGAGLGAFQNFAVVRPGQQIYFARDVAQSACSVLGNVWNAFLGDTYS
jgi:hypothetical protein